MEKLPAAIVLISPFIILLIVIFCNLDNVRRSITVFGAMLALVSMAIGFRICYVSGLPDYSFFYVDLTNLPLLGAVAFYLNSKNKEFYIGLIRGFNYIVLFSNILLWLPIILIGDPVVYMSGVFLGLSSSFLCFLFFIFYAIKSKLAKMCAPKKAAIDLGEIKEEKNG